MENRNNEQNLFTIAGFITNIRKTPKSIVVTLSTSPTRNRNLRDYPSIVCFGPLEDEIKECNVGEHIIVTCSMQTVPYKEGRNGKTSFLVGKKIEKQKSVIENQTGINIGLSYDDKNEGVLCGEVKHIFIPEKQRLAIVTIAAKNGNRVSFPTVSCFEYSYNYIKNNVKEGDTIAIACYIQTKNNKEKGIFYETIVAREVKKVEE